MDWLSLALGLLKLANLVMGYVSTEQAKQSGRDEVIAREALAVLQKTEAGKKLWEKIDALDEGGVGDLLDRLGK